MKQSTKKILYWSPRILCILFALFTSIFAFDVFEGQHPFGEILLALFMHLIPTFFIIFILILAWRWEWIGGIAFILLSISYVVWVWGRFPLLVYIVICGPMLIISILFFISWNLRKDIKTKHFA
jgi:hypothetical protein